MGVTRSKVLYQDSEIANPGANTGVVATEIAASRAESGVMTIKSRGAPQIRVSVSPSTTSIISVTNTDPASNVIKHVLNDGVACTAGADANNVRTYQIDLVAVSGNTYDVEFQTSQTGNTAKIYGLVIQQLEL